MGKIAFPSARAWVNSDQHHLESDQLGVPMRMTAERGEVPQTAGLRSDQQPVHDLPHDQWGHNAIVTGSLAETHEPQRGVEQFGIKGTDIDTHHAATVSAWVHDARRLDHYRRDDRRVEDEAHAEVRSLARSVNDLSAGGQVHRADEVVSRVVPQSLVGD